MLYALVKLSDKGMLTQQQQQKNESVFLRSRNGEIFVLNLCSFNVNTNAKSESGWLKAEQ